MARYVDGFLIPIRKNKVAAYRGIARKAGRVWMKYGALEYRECVLDDQPKGAGKFTSAARAKPGEVVIFAWIVFRSKAHRNQVNAKVMSDPGLARQMEKEAMPFDVKRMSYGGFNVLVDLYSRRK